MANITLPKLTEKRAEYNHFPTLFQNFIFRNWESVPTKKLAEVLGTDDATVNALAADMGLRVPAKYNPGYRDRGFLTVIRNNWHLLPYAQLLTLVDKTEDELAFTLREDDFFDVKLGFIKPDVPPLSYRPLTDEEKEGTAKIKENLLKKIPTFGKKTEAEDFDFTEKFKKKDNITFDGALRAVVLDGSWGIRDNSNGKYTKSFCDFLASYGISLSGNEKFISIEICEDFTKKSESHSIKIAKGGIKVVSVDEVGVLRALDFLRKLIEQNRSFSFDEAEIVRDTRFDIRYIYSYCALFGDPFLDGGVSSYPDSILEEYSKIGINGIWLHAVLYKLCRFPWDESVSDGYEARLAGLKNLCDRAEKYGIKVYLYINEPRAMSKALFEKHPAILGFTFEDAGVGTLCTSKKEVRDYLYDGIKTICEAAPNIGGFFTITASENVTNCHSHFEVGKCPCEVCNNRLPEEIYAEVNATIKKAAASVREDIEVIAFTWGWNQCKNIETAIELCAKSGVRVMCVSEEGVEKTIGGVTTAVSDYSISLVGPGKKAKKIWETAKNAGGRTMAKVQFNNTWECSTVPYLPVLDLVKKHMEGICENDVDGLMLSWSLGGYPSMNLTAMSKYFFIGESDYDVYAEMFGENAEVIRRATADFSRAFINLPFHVRAAYLAPFQTGPSNLLFEKASGLAATMTGYPYDDVENWRAIFPVEVFADSLKTLSEIWKDGLTKLLADVKIDCDATREFVEVARACYCIYRSSYIQTRYNLLRDEFNNGKKELRKEILALLDEEESLTLELYDVVTHNSATGYEASNHYAFNKYTLAEKIVNIDYLKKYFA